MKDSTRLRLSQWGYEQGEIDAVAQLERLGVEIDLFVLAQVIAINRKVVKLMADVSGLETEITALTGAEEGIVSALNEVKDELSTLEAGNVSQETIDGLTAKVTNVVTALNSAVTPATPPAEPPAEETPATPPVEETPPEAPAE